jgi:hypothetical protein
MKTVIGDFRMTVIVRRNDPRSIPAPDDSAAVNGNDDGMDEITGEGRTPAGCRTATTACPRRAGMVRHELP